MAFGQAGLKNQTLLVIIVVGLLIGFYYLGVLTPLERLGSTALRPFQLAAVAITDGLERLLKPFSDIAALEEENRALRQDNHRLLTTVASLQQRVAEQTSLVSQVEFLSERRFTYAPARVLGQTADPTFHSIILNVGQAQNVAIGQAVVVADGVLVGTIRSVEFDHAEVLLISDSRSVIDVSVQNDAATPGVISGQFSAHLFMDLIPQGEPIALGDIIVTRPGGAVSYGGLVIGRVVETTSKPGELFQSALIAPAASFDTISVVSVITGQE